MDDFTRGRTTENFEEECPMRDVTNQSAIGRSIISQMKKYRNYNVHRVSAAIINPLTSTQNYI